MPEAARADPLPSVVRLVRHVLGDAALGAYLHGSAVHGGLRPTSDVDVLVVTLRSATPDERRALVAGLLEVSGRRARRGPARPVELTIVVLDDVRPWRYPPIANFQYGEWLRDDYEAGLVPAAEPSPDLALLVTAARAAGRTLFGPPPSEALDDVPPADVRVAAVAGIPGLLADLETDTRNVLLTLARIWLTLETGEIGTKDAAATWAAARLAGDDRRLLLRARAMYRGEIDEPDDDAGWAADREAVRGLVDRLIAHLEPASADAELRVG